MTSIAAGSVRIQTAAESVPSTPSWFGEVVLLSTPCALSMRAQQAL